MKTDKKIIEYKDLAKLREKATKEGKKIAFTSGCYDILHLGHVIHLNYCKEKADFCVVSVGNDKNVRELKGPERPINDESFRARMLAALECVDFVVISEEMGIMDHNKVCELLRPDFYVVPGTDKFLDDKKELAEKYGGKLIACKRLPPEHKKGGISTTQIANKLKEK